LHCGEQMTNDTRPIFVIRLRPVAGDGARDLRRLLKFALRICHLRALSVIEEGARYDLQEQ
jgi:hypothetical protein